MVQVVQLTLWQYTLGYFVLEEEQGTFLRTVYNLLLINIWNNVSEY